MRGLTSSVVALAALAATGGTASASAGPCVLTGPLRLGQPQASIVPALGSVPFSAHGQAQCGLEHGTFTLRGDGAALLAGPCPHVGGSQVKLTIRTQPLISFGPSAHVTRLRGSILGGLDGALSGSVVGEGRAVHGTSVFVPSAGCGGELRLVVGS